VTTKAKTKKKAVDRAPAIPPRDFIKAWQTSSGVEEVNAKLGGGHRAATLSGRAVGMRKRGIVLKKFASAAGDNEDLAAYAAELLNPVESVAPPATPEPAIDGAGGDEDPEL